MDINIQQDFTIAKYLFTECEFLTHITEKNVSQKGQLSFLAEKMPFDTVLGKFRLRCSALGPISSFFRKQQLIDTNIIFSLTYFSIKRIIIILALCALSDEGIVIKTTHGEPSLGIPSAHWGGTYDGNCF
ncbi:MAG: hypothetical protein ACOYD9_07245 [Pyramidobacter sp.]|jgi:hypothetical protein